jgi:mannose/fructose/N-acetylgalactosamine-specific phosphotransferase system component IIC
VQTSVFAAGNSMIGVEQWCLLILLAGLVAQDTTAGPQIRFCEPFGAGPIAGWIVGDVSIGVLFGIAALLIWSGTMPAGMAAFFDAYVGAVVAVAVGALVGGSAVAFLWVLPVGYLGSALTVVERGINGRIVDSVRSDDSPRMIGVRHMSGWIISGVRGAITALLGLSIGVFVVPPITAAIESVISPIVLWAAVFGTGGGIALGVTWKYSHGRAAAVGALAIALVLLVGRYLP